MSHLFPTSVELFSPVMSDCLDTWVWESLRALLKTGAMVPAVFILSRRKPSISLMTLWLLWMQTWPTTFCIGVFWGC